LLLDEKVNDLRPDRIRKTLDDFNQNNENLSLEVVLLALRHCDMLIVRALLFGCQDSDVVDERKDFSNGLLDWLSDRIAEEVISISMELGHLFLDGPVELEAPEENLVIFVGFSGFKFVKDLGTVNLPMALKCRVDSFGNTILQRLVGFGVLGESFLCNLVEAEFGIPVLVVVINSLDLEELYGVSIVEDWGRLGLLDIGNNSIGNFATVDLLVEAAVGERLIDFKHHVVGLDVKVEGGSGCVGSDGC
jgi:hypothetical protein